MNPLERMRKKCHKLGMSAPDTMEYDTIMKICAKIIVKEKVLDDDAFEHASKAFAEGFNGLHLGGTDNAPSIN
jgi:hypothetical protein